MRTSTTCTDAGFIQQQISDVENGQLILEYGETDLQYLGGQRYDQSDFWAKVTPTFQDSSDPDTYAALIVNTPLDGARAGGFIFGITCTGLWRLQRVVSGSEIPTIMYGKVSASLSPRLEVQVHNGQLQGIVNGQVVVTWSDTLGNPSEMGIMTQRDGQQTSSAVQYNDFELLFWG